MSVRRPGGRYTREGQRRQGLLIALVIAIATVGIVTAMVLWPRQAPSPDGAWELVFQDGSGFYVLVDADRGRDRAVYDAAVDTLCRGLTRCNVRFWQTRANMPTVMAPTDSQLQSVTARAWIDRNAGVRRFQWNCRYVAADGCFTS